MITGIGCDIVAIQRFKDKTRQLAERILTPQELVLFETMSETRKPEWLAGRFAAKEAIVKAINRDVAITKIAILTSDEGKPICELEGYSILVSISHEKEYAIAYAIVQNI